MSYLVFDIETIGKPYDEFDEKSKAIFEDWASYGSKTEEEKDKALEAIKEGMPLSPFLGEIVTVSVLDEEGKGGTYFQAPKANIEDFEEEGIRYRVCTEKEILEKFWEVAENYNKFVTFNGREFDVPYLMIRSAIHKVKPTKNLMSHRYMNSQRENAKHVDLSDQLTFYGSVRRRPKLHFATQAFGITSPKEGDIDGKEVPKAFADKRYEEIARYCMNDVYATRELYKYWNDYLNI